MSVRECSIAQVDGESAEAVAEIFRRWGPTSVVVEEVKAPRTVVGFEPPQEPDRFTVRLYLTDQAESVTDDVRRAVWYLHIIRALPDLVVRDLDDVDWESQWRASHGAMRVGQRLVVTAPWDETAFAADDVVVRIEPGSAFGTGAHPTTRLALELIESAVCEGDRVADVGCGSGVLGVAAARLGAGDVVGCDIDHAAIGSTVQEAQRNDVGDRVKVFLGSVDEMEGPFDVVVMNIIAERLVGLLPAAAPMLRPGGALLLSGILTPSEGAVLEALRTLEGAWTPVERRVDGDWIAVHWTLR